MTEHTTSSAGGQGHEAVRGKEKHASFSLVTVSPADFAPLKLIIYWFALNTEFDQICTVLILALKFH